LHTTRTARVVRTYLHTIDAATILRTYLHTMTLTEGLDDEELVGAN
jgi:hypothetical protein